MGEAVVDASVLIDALPADDGNSSRRELEKYEIHAPHLIGVEVLSWLRRYGSTGDRTIHPQLIRQHYIGLRITRRPHEPLLARAWELRQTVSAYDAQYVALAEALEAPLITRDRRLAAAAAPYCAVVVP